jgi:hypothetical protein
VTCLGGRCFAKIDEGRATIGEPQKYEPAAADVACERMDYSEREAYGYCCINHMAA